jgi:acetyl-CoA carboxylase carboxyltransferase component
VGWLSKLVDDGLLLDVDGARIDLKHGISAEAIAQDDGAIAGTARIGGIPVAVFAQEPTYKGGSMGLGHIRRLGKLVKIATDKKLPIVGLYDSGGARVQEGGSSVEEASALVGSLIRAKEVVPVISAVMGTISGGASYAASLGDALVMIRGTSRMFIWGPGVVKAETGVDVGTEDLGGTDVHMANGTASMVVNNETECLDLVKRMVGYFAFRHAKAIEPEPGFPGEGAVETISKTFDAGSFLEFRSFFAKSVVTGLARLQGETVGVVASNKAVLGGFMDVDSCKKAAKFASVCNSLRIPLVTFLDSPGFYPGAEQEREGLIMFSGEAVREYASDRCPKVAVVTGEAYGGVFLAFASKALGTKRVFAYPKAKISVMSLSAYLETFYRKKLDSLSEMEKKKQIDRIAAEFTKNMDPNLGVEQGYIDEVIDPSETRSKLISALGLSSS